MNTANAAVYPVTTPSKQLNALKRAQYQEKKKGHMRPPAMEMVMKPQIRLMVLTSSESKRPASITKTEDNRACHNS